MREKIAGIILAAGRSSRMGTPKPLLKIGRKTFLDIIKNKLLQSGIKDIYLVLGAGADRLKESLNTDKLTVIINESWSDGQLSSLKRAVESLPENTDGILMCLIDHPKVNRSTIKKLMDAAGVSPADIIVPSYRKRGGHPVIFKKSVFQAILDAPLNEGARSVIRKEEFRTLRLDIEDRAIVQDIDTREEYSRIGKRD